MKLVAKQFLEVLSKVQLLGASKIESNNVVIHRNPDSKALTFAVTSRSTHLIVESQITTSKWDDGFFFEGAISINLATLTSILTGMKELPIEVNFNEENDNYIRLKSEYETYDIAYYKISSADTDAIFDVDHSGAKVLLDDEPASTVAPIGTMITNINLLCVDSQFKTILHRKGREMHAVFITNTTMNVFSATLQEKEAYSDASLCYGVDTNTVFVPRVLAQVLSYLGHDDRVTLKYDSGNMFIIVPGAMLRTTYETKEGSLDRSVEAYNKMRSIIDMLKDTTVTVKAGGFGLENLIKKSAVLISKGSAAKLTSYVPLHIMSESEVMVQFKASSGAYSSSIKSSVNVEGLPKDYKPSDVMFNMSVPMMSSILGTLNKTYGQVRVIIEMREDKSSDKIYIKIYSESSDRVCYYLRLKR